LNRSIPTPSPEPDPGVIEPRPSLKDIAREAGVGKATVSLALRNDPRLRAETRARIQRVAEKLGYRANPTVAKLMFQLRASRTPRYEATIALLNASPDPTYLRSVATFRRWVDGAKARAAQLGFSIDEFWMHDPSTRPSRLISIIESRGIQGLFLAGVQGGNRLPEAFDPLWEKLPAVVVGLRPEWPPVHFTSNDQYSTALRCARHLLSLGYRRPGLVLERMVDDLVDRKFSAAFHAATDHLAEADRIPVCAFDRSRPEAFRKWFTAHRPDAILTLHDEVRRWLDAAGARIPADVGLAHMDLGPNQEGWSGMNQISEHVGSAAMDLLTGQIHRNETGIPAFPKCMLIEGQWIEGETTRKQRAPARVKPAKMPVA
jgi:LacI family transcriptional regulator